MPQQNLRISQLPFVTSGSPDSIMVMVDYTTEVTGVTSAIYFSSITSSISGTTGSSGLSGSSGTSGSSGASGLGAYLPLSGGTVTGNTYFGITSGITIDQVNKRFGINTKTPQHTVEVFGANSSITYRDTSGGAFEISGYTDLPRFSVAGAPTITKPLIGMSVGVRSWDDVTFPGYGKVGDGHLYASNEMNGLNIINRQSSSLTTEDYIRFYAGQGADAATPDIHIQGTGSTRGYVGIGTINPTANLDINGKTKVINLQMTSGATANYIMVSDASGNGFWTGLTESQIPTRYYGAFYDGGTQPLLSGNTPQVMSANTTTYSNGVVISGGTKFVVQHSGVYNLQFSAQLYKTSSGTDEVAIWFRKNGVDMSDSNTEMHVPKQGASGKLVAAWNIVEQLNANEYLEIVWASVDVTYSLLHQVAQVSPYAKPSTPSIIVTVTQV
jgi:hypothetical protein